MEEYRILAPTAILGYGFPLSSFEEGMKRKPHLIAVDAGSTDPGPYYLGAGVSFTQRRAVKRDLAVILKAAVSTGIPAIIGSAGGSGGEPHLLWNLEIIKEVASEEGLNFKLALIKAEIDKELVYKRWKEGKLLPLEPAPDLVADELHKTIRIVGQMGVEPIIEALKSGAQVILAGRAYDPAVFAAPAIEAGFPVGLSVHLGKILECAAIAATPGSGSDCLFGYLKNNSFEVEPLNPLRRCTTLSVAAHTLYEKSDPYLLPGPGGLLDLKDAHFEQVCDRMVRVSGSQFKSTSPYRIKLEGVKRIGYRTISIAGTRDPLMIKEIDNVIDGVRKRVADNFREEKFTYFLDFKIYGKNGVMGALEPSPVATGHELGIIIEAVAATQELADTICGFARATMLHYGYKGRVSTAGNLAFPYSPSDFQAGEVYAFSLYHLIEVESPLELFPQEILEIRGKG
jgi:hypothetical protein